MKKILRLSIIPCLIFLFISSCSQSDGSDGLLQTTLKLSENKFELSDKKETKYILVETNCKDWSVKSKNNSWMSFNIIKDTLFFTVEENNDIARTAIVEVIANEKLESFTVSQEQGYPKTFDVFPLYFLEFGRFFDSLTEVDIYEYGIGYLERQETYLAEDYDLIVFYTTPIVERAYMFDDNLGNNLIRIMLTFPISEANPNNSNIAVVKEDDTCELNPNFEKLANKSGFEQYADSYTEEGTTIFYFKSEEKNAIAIIVKDHYTHSETIHYHPLQQ